MKLLGLWLTLFGLIAIQSGCAICCAPDDPTYAAMGGLFERHDATRGRVGSAFSDVASRVEISEAEAAVILKHPGREVTVRPARATPKPGLGLVAVPGRARD